MHIRTGIDLVEVSRVEKAIQKQHFIDIVYTKKEQEYCNARGKGRRAGGAMTEIEILNDEAGCPQVTLYGSLAERAEGLGIKEISISMTHVKE